MENPAELNHDPTDSNPGLRKRRRIPFTSSDKVLSSDQIKAETPETLDSDLDETEDPTLSGDLDLEQSYGEDALPDNYRYLEEEHDFDEDSQNEESGRSGGFGSEEEGLEDELDDEAAEGDGVLGFLDDETE